MTCPSIHIETIDDAKTMSFKLPPLILKFKFEITRLVKDGITDYDYEAVCVRSIYGQKVASENKNISVLIPVITIINKNLFF